MRDIRDPATLGQALLDMKKQYPNVPLSDIASGKYFPGMPLAQDVPYKEFNGHSNGLNGNTQYRG